MDFNSKRVAVQACALVALGNIGQVVGGFYLKYAKYIHGRIVPPIANPRNNKGISAQPVLNPVREWDPSQNGLLADWPQRQSDPRIFTHSCPNWLCRRRRPRNVMGPSLMHEIVILLGR